MGLSEDVTDSSFMNPTFRGKKKTRKLRSIRNILDSYFFFFCVRVRIGKQRVDSEQSIADRGGKMEMDVVNYGYHTECTTHA